MKNFKKVSNYSFAGLLAVGVFLLSFFAYREKISADTIVPGYATAHVNIHVTVPIVEDVPFKVTFLPQTKSPNYYFKDRNFSLTGSGLNTIEWYIRKIPSGTYKVVVESNGQELSGSQYVVNLVNDKVNDTTSFDLNLGEPTPSPVADTSASAGAADSGYTQDQIIVPGQTVSPTPTPQAADSIPPDPVDSQTTSDQNYSPSF